MKIGLYKPYKKILFNDTTDTNSWSRELVNFSKIFANNGHHVYLLSDTDYTGNIDNIKACTLEDITELDYLCVSNGVFDRDIHTEQDMFDIKNKLKCKIVLLETDLLLSTKYHDIDAYDIILTQSPTIGKRVYAHLEKLILYQHPLCTASFELRNNRGVFIGFERDRTRKISEYVYRPNITWKGKSELFDFNDKANKDELNELLQTHTFSIVCSGDAQNSFGFLSQRYFENAVNGIINFVDFEYDKHELIIPHTDFRRIHNFVELTKKSKQLDKKLFTELQTQQFEQISKWTSGELLYMILLEALHHDEKK